MSQPSRLDSGIDLFSRNVLSRTSSTAKEAWREKSVTEPKTTAELLALLEGRLVWRGGWGE